jgi:hypothetical protein
MILLGLGTVGANLQAHSRFGGGIGPAVRSRLRIIVEYSAHKPRGDNVNKSPLTTPYNNPLARSGAPTGTEVCDPLVHVLMG